MKFVSFEVATPVGRTPRLGGLLDANETGRIADLTACFACYLAASTDEPTPRELAHLRVPPDMIGFLRAGKEGMKAAQAGSGICARQYKRHGSRWRAARLRAQ